MEHAKKMILVPLDTIHPQNHKTEKQENKHQQQQDSLPSVQTVGNNLSRLDSEIHRVLTSNNYADEHEKYKNYLQVLHRYLHFKNMDAEFPAEKKLDEGMEVDGKEGAEEIKMQTPDTKKFTTVEILASVPKSYEKKAASLLKYWENEGKLTFNEETGTVAVEGQAIENSNITDFLNSVVRKKKLEENIAGWNEFLNFMASSNIPENLISNPSFLESLKEIKKREKKQTSEEKKDSPEKSSKPWLFFA